MSRFIQGAHRIVGSIGAGRWRQVDGEVESIGALGDLAERKVGLGLAFQFRSIEIHQPRIDGVRSGITEADLLKG